MQKKLRNPNIREVSKGTQFSKTRQPTDAQRKKAARNMSVVKQKKREIRELLALALTGEAGDQIKELIKEQFGDIPATVEEALHFMQIVKALSERDTFAYKALMDVAGITKPTKIAQTDTEGNNITWNETRTYEADKKADAGS